jgi:hypothetical protein
MAFNDPDLEDDEKAYVCLFILFPEFDAFKKSDYEEAYKKALEFIDYNTKDDRPMPRTMDWEQDEGLLFPAVNTVAGYETRTAKYVHWRTCVGYYMEISGGIFSNILTLRYKKAKGKKLEKHEREFWNANKNVCVLRPKLSEEEQAEKDRLKALLD